MRNAAISLDRRAAPFIRSNNNNADRAQLALGNRRSGGAGAARSCVRKSNFRKGNPYEIDYVASWYCCTELCHLGACARRITLRGARRKSLYHCARHGDAHAVGEVDRYLGRVTRSQEKRDSGGDLAFT